MTRRVSKQKAIDSYDKTHTSVECHGMVCSSESQLVRYLYTDGLSRNQTSPAHKGVVHVFSLSVAACVSATVGMAKKGR